MKRTVAFIAIIVMALSLTAAKRTNPPMAPDTVAGGVVVDIGCSPDYQAPISYYGHNWGYGSAEPGTWRVFSWQAQPGTITVKTGKTVIYTGPIWSYGISGTHAGLELEGTLARGKLTVTIDGETYRYSERRC